MQNLLAASPSESATPAVAASTRCECSEAHVRQRRTGRPSIRNSVVPELCCPPPSDEAAGRAATIALKQTKIMSKSFPAVIRDGLNVLIDTHLPTTPFYQHQVVVKLEICNIVFRFSGLS